MFFPSGNLPGPIVYRTTNRTSHILTGERVALVSRWNYEVPDYLTKLTAEVCAESLDAGDRRFQDVWSFESLTPLPPTVIFSPSTALILSQACVEKGQKGTVFCAE